MTILLVRHARAGRRDKWTGDDRLRPLTKRGRAQADALVERLGQWKGDHVRVVSSPWVRCAQTVEPLARSWGVGVDLDDILGEGMGPKAADDLPNWMLGPTTVLCTHGDVIEEILADLAQRGVPLGRRPWAAKGAVWVLDGDGRFVERAEYLAPV